MQDKLLACVGTAMSATGTLMQTNELLQTISLIITIIGGIISFIIIPVVNWYRKSKADDGKIDADELKEGINIVKDGVEELVDKTKGDNKDA